MANASKVARGNLSDVMAVESSVLECTMILFDITEIAEKFAKSFFKNISLGIHIEKYRSLCESSRIDVSISIYVSFA